MKTSATNVFLDDEAQKSFCLSSVVKIDYNDNIVTLSDKKNVISFPCIRFTISDRKTYFLFLDFDGKTLLQFCNGYVTLDQTKFEMNLSGTEVEELRSIRI